MKKTPVVAVLDVGKTNKKLALYDESFKALDLKKINLDAIPGPDGEDYEQTDALIDWVLETLSSFSDTYEIRVISISTHGATLGVLDSQGRDAYPVLSYLSTAGDSLEESFYEEFGTVEELHRETCTSPFSFANAAKQLNYFKKNRPEVWEKIDRLLFFPQYLGYRLTGQTAADPTYLGCHTYLWKFPEGGPSSVAEKLGSAGFLPARIEAPWDELGTLLPELAKKTGVSPKCKVCVGIHDSNASILPYFAQGLRDFTLNSTGSWCVAMTPSENCDLAPEELGTKTFYNLSAFNTPIKTSIFPGGMEYSEFREKNPEDIEPDDQQLASIVRERRIFLTGGVLEGAKAFPHSKPGLFVDDVFIPLERINADCLRQHSLAPGEYTAALNLSLAIQTRQTLQRSGLSAGKRVFTEGGFLQNKMYCQILATLLPDNPLEQSDLTEATSFGAALCGWKLDKGIADLDQFANSFSVNFTPVSPLPLDSLEAYAEAYEQKTS